MKLVVKHLIFKVPEITLITRTKQLYQNLYVTLS
jgi:hypothetical protein